MEFLKGRYWLGIILIYCISLFMHLPHFGKDILSFHSWRQAQTQSTINNFYEEDMNIFHPRRNDRGNGEGIKRMEFPLMQWLIASTYHLTGKSVLVSRLFVFIVGLISIAGIYQLIFVLFKNPIMALMGAWAFNFSPSFYFYTINPQPDNMALASGIWGLVFFFKWLENNKDSMLFIGALLFALSSLIKLPFITYYVLPFVLFFFRFLKQRHRFKWKDVFIFFVPILLPLVWYAWVIPQWDSNPVVWGMLENQDGVDQLLYYLWFNLTSNLPELLLNYGSVPFFIFGFYFMRKRKAFRDPRFKLWFAISMGVLAYYLFEANAIAKVHDYYLFPFFPILFVIVAFGAYHLFRSEKKIFKYFTLIALIYLPIGCHLRMMNRWNPESPGYNPDLLKYKIELRNAVPQNALVIAGNDNSKCIFLYQIDRKGWGFSKDEITQEELLKMVDEGAEYLFTDSPMISHEGIFNSLEQPIQVFGSIKIYDLRELHQHDI